MSRICLRFVHSTTHPILRIEKCPCTGRYAMARGKRRSQNTQAQNAVSWSSTPLRECSKGFARVNARAELARACAQVPEAPQTASPQLIQARELLKTLPSNREAFIRHLKKMKSEDPIHGPMNLHWCFSALARALPPGTGQDYFLEVAKTSLREGVAMRRLRQGWEQFGRSPWEVVHHRPEPWIPRYHSEPTLHGHTQAL